MSLPRCRIRTLMIAVGVVAIVLASVAAYVGWLRAHGIFVHDAYIGDFSIRF